MITIQHWEGVIDEVHDEYFTATLTDLTQGGTDEWAEIPNGAVKDKAYIRERVIFHMKVKRFLFWSWLEIRFNKERNLSRKQKEIRRKKIEEKASYLEEKLKWK